MEFSKLSAPSLKDLFVREIRGRILSGELTAGTPLPSERELAQQMQVSRAVVNGGLTELARQGFVTVVPRSGTVVADYRRSGTIDTLLAIMDFQGQTLGKEEIRSLLQVRRALEKLAVHLAAEAATDQEIRELGGLLDALADSGTPAQGAQAAYAFHHQLMLISGNTILPLLYCSCRGPVTALWTQFIVSYGPGPLIRHMETLYSHLSRRDAQGAALWIDSYLEQILSGPLQLGKTE